MEPKETVERIVLASLAMSSVAPIKGNFLDINPKPQVAQFEQIEFETQKEEKDLTQAPYEFLESRDIVSEVNLQDFDFPKLSEYSLSSIENLQKDNIFQTTQNTLMYLIPLDNEQNVLEKLPVKQFGVKQGMNFEIAQKRILINEFGESVEINLLGNTFGGKNFVAAILGKISSNGKETSFLTGNFESIEDSATYIVTEDSVYPNKILNVLKAFGYLTDVGELKKDELYSYLSIIGLNNRSILFSYEQGRNSGGSVVYAGGVCATATGVSSLLSQVKGVEILPLGIGRWTHPGPYAQGPFSADWRDIDATVSYNGEGVSYDLIWKMNRNGYIKIDAQILPSGLAFDETDEYGLGHVSDVSAIFSLSFTEDEPVGQKEMLEYLWNSYDSFRESQHSTPLPSQDELEESRFEPNEEVKNVIDLVYLKQEADLYSFPSEIDISVLKLDTRRSYNLNAEIR